MQEGELYAKENGLSFLETSAKTAQNVNELFYEIGNTIFYKPFSSFMMQFEAHLTMYSLLSMAVGHSP